MVGIPRLACVISLEPLADGDDLDEPSLHLQAWLNRPLRKGSSDRRGLNRLEVGEVVIGAARGIKPYGAFK